VERKSKDIKSHGRKWNDGESLTTNVAVEEWEKSYSEGGAKEGGHIDAQSRNAVRSP